MSQPPPPGSGLSPILSEFVFLAIVILAVTWTFARYIGPIAASSAYLVGGPLSVSQP